MEITSQILAHKTQVIPHQVISSWLQEYVRPNDKISYLLSQGHLQSLKKGIYIAGPKLSNQRPDSFLIANHLMGPSYVSTESALSFYGLIPERVFETTSMTVKASRTYDTPVGVFSYQHLPLPYYSFGLRIERLSDTQFVIMASPEKAICDKIVSTRELRFRNTKNAYEFLIENMRMDESRLKAFNTDWITSWIDKSPKSQSLKMLLKFIQEL